MTSSSFFVTLVRNTVIAVCLSLLVTYLVFSLFQLNTLSLTQALLISAVFPLLLTPLISHRFYAANKELEAVTRSLHRTSYLDELTDLYTRRYFFEIAQRELSSAERYNYSVSVMLIDLDHFTEVNQSLGHLFGDHVLRHCADIIKSDLRDTDFCARFGGEEFIVLMPYTTAQHLKLVAERIRERIASMPVSSKDQDYHITVSIGAVASIRGDSNTEELIQRAEAALKTAKDAGRNRVILAHAESVVA